jgi:hypothetical protein
MDLERDAKINRARQHGWELIQWSDDGTAAQLIRTSAYNIHIVEFGLGTARGWTCWR